MFIHARPRGDRFHLGSLGSFPIALGVIGFTLGVVGFIRFRWVYSGGSWLSSGSFVFVAFVKARPGCRLLRLVRFSGAPSPGSCGFVGFILARPGCRLLRWVRSFAPWGCRVHSGSLSLFRRVLAVVGFIRVHWVYSGAPLGSPGSFVLVCFIRARPPVLDGSFGRALGVLRLFWVRLVHPWTPWGSS